MDVVALTDLERELLELCSMAGEPTILLDKEMLEDSPGRAIVEATLRGLRTRGLLTSERGIVASEQAAREDDWRDLTATGREAIGLPPRPSLSS